MDYEKKIRDYMNSSEVDQLYKSMLNNLFPELVEPQEEKARRSLLEFLEDLFKLGKNINFDRWSKADCEEWVNWVMKQGEQKPAEWRITDEDMFRTAVWHIKNSISKGKPDTITKSDILDWFITLKERVQPRQEWSEEDKMHLNAAIHLANNTGHIETANWLKSLEDRYTWKPNNEHYELEEFAKIVRSNLTGISKAVQKLFEAKYLQLTGRKMYGGFKD